MGLKRMLCGKWFNRLVLVGWIVCAVSILAVFKNMEQIVHGQLYSYGLVFSPDWADPYRLFTWLLFVCLGLPTALSGVALVSTFLKIENVPRKKTIVPQKIQSPRVVKMASRPTTRMDQIEKSEGSLKNGGISCPKCNKIFGQALVMLDFSGGKKHMVSVCPYCNYILGNTDQKQGTKELHFHVALSDEELVNY